MPSGWTVCIANVTVEEHMDGYVVYHSNPVFLDIVSLLMFQVYSKIESSVLEYSVYKTKVTVQKKRTTFTWRGVLVFRHELDLPNGVTIDQTIIQLKSKNKVHFRKN